jgi:hypothetical protein
MAFCNCLQLKRSYSLFRKGAIFQISQKHTHLFGLPLDSNEAPLLVFSGHAEPHHEEFETNFFCSFTPRKLTVTRYRCNTMRLPLWICFAK